jgi:TetR/AcrR family transcriptional repressor of nem operon
LSDLLDLYLSLDQRDNLADGCAMATSASEIAWQDGAVSTRFAEGFGQWSGRFRRRWKRGCSGLTTARTLTIGAAMIGGVAIAWATAKSRPDLT